MAIRSGRRRCRRLGYIQDGGGTRCFGGSRTRANPGGGRFRRLGIGLLRHRLAPWRCGGGIGIALDACGFRRALRRLLRIVFSNNTANRSEYFLHRWFLRLGRLCHAAPRLTPLAASRGPSLLLRFAESRHRHSAKLPSAGSLRKPTATAAIRKTAAYPPRLP